LAHAGRAWRRSARCRATFVTLDALSRGLGLGLRDNVRAGPPPRGLERGPSTGCAAFSSRWL